MRLVHTTKTPIKGRGCALFLSCVLLLAACGSESVSETADVDPGPARVIGELDGAEAVESEPEAGEEVEVEGAVETQDADDTPDESAAESTAEQDDVDENDAVDNDENGDEDGSEIENDDADAGSPDAAEPANAADDNTSDVPQAAPAAEGLGDDGSSETQADVSAPTTTRPPAPAPDPGPATTITPEDVETLESAPVNDEGFEPGSGTPDFDAALEEVSLDTPCGIFSEQELSSFVDSEARSAGVFDQLPAGLGADSDLVFAVASESQTSCDWFSDPFIWFVAISWEAADPTFVETAFSGLPTFGNDAFTAAILDDTSGQLVINDLFIRVTNLIPGNTQMTSDRDVTEALIAEVANRLG